MENKEKSKPKNKEGEEVTKAIKDEEEEPMKAKREDGEAALKARQDFTKNLQMTGIHLVPCVFVPTSLALS